MSRYRSADGTCSQSTEIYRFDKPNFFFFLHGSAIDAVGDNYDEVTVHGWHPDTL